jgi:hypothetical protein
MPRIPLVSAAYAGKSIIASGQECVNLYAEGNVQFDPQAPAPVTYYLTPGTSLFGQNTEYVFPARGLYRTSRDTTYYVVGQQVYFVSNDGTLTVVGIIASRPSLIKMKDNGQVVILVDGVNGYVIDMNTNAFATITDPSFLGSDYVELLDTFFIFNRPNTNQFYISLSNSSYGMLTNTAIQTGTITSGGTLYTNGTYLDIPLTGGSGSGARANLIVSGGAVTTVSIVDPGVNYIIGDALSVDNASIGGAGSGFVWTVNTTATAFDPLDIAAKSGFNDPILAIASVHRELWLIGNLTTEVWIGTGAADFYFQQVQGAYINHGAAAHYSIASQDISVFFLHRDMQGDGLVLQGTGYEVAEISTPRIVSEFKSYPTIDDAIGFCYQIEDHAFYELVFPTADKGWIYDLTTKQWSEKIWIDDNGNHHRPRENCCSFSFGKILVGDWESGNLLQLNKDAYTDYANSNPETPIIRIRTFPHLIDNNDRVSTLSFDADMEVGTILDQDATPQISLSWSDDKGRTYGNPIMQSLGKTGEYLTTVSWNRLGQARDRVFKLSWSAPFKTALNGGFIERKKART